MDYDLRKETVGPPRKFNHREFCLHFLVSKFYWACAIHIKEMASLFPGPEGKNNKL